MEIGTTIQELRKKQGIKQGKFAESINISSTSLSQIENNNTIPKASTLDKICKRLGITQELLYLLSISEDNIPEKNRDKFAGMFPQVRKMMIQIFSESDDTLLFE